LSASAIIAKFAQNCPKLPNLSKFAQRQFA
jgi:hypothetical protein